MNLGDPATQPQHAPAEHDRETVRLGRAVECAVLLILARGESYGYDIRRQLITFGYDQSDSSKGVLYRLLRDLEAAGSISSVWNTTGTGPARRYYSLTDAGRQRLEVGAGRLANLRRRIDLFFSNYAAFLTGEGERVATPAGAR